MTLTQDLSSSSSHHCCCEVWICRGAGDIAFRVMAAWQQPALLFTVRQGRIRTPMGGTLWLISLDAACRGMKCAGGAAGLLRATQLGLRLPQPLLVLKLLNHW
jgi:hypothetical protein